MEFFRISVKLRKSATGSFLQIVESCDHQGCVRKKFPLVISLRNFMIGTIIKVVKSSRLQLNSCIVVKT